MDILCQGLFRHGTEKGRHWEKSALGQDKKADCVSVLYEPDSPFDFMPPSQQDVASLKR